MCSSREAGGAHLSFPPRIVPAKIKIKSCPAARRGEMNDAHACYSGRAPSFHETFICATGRDSDIVLATLEAALRGTSRSSGNSTQLNSNQQSTPAKPREESSHLTSCRPACLPVPTSRAPRNYLSGKEISAPNARTHAKTNKRCADANARSPFIHSKRKAAENNTTSLSHLF